MKILLLTDSFNSGGAQKQIMMLANGLVDENYKVATLQYYKLFFFSKYLDHRISRFETIHVNKLIRVFKILHTLYLFKPDCIISFLHGPNNYAALYKIIFFWRKTRLITGERNLNIEELKLKDRLIRVSHFFANKVVCNTNAQKLIIEKLFKNKVLFIPNGTSIDNIVVKEKYGSEKGVLKLIVPARFTHQKNPLNLLKALSAIKSNRDLKIEVYWYGRIDANENIYNESLKYIRNNNLETFIFFKEPVSNIYAEMINFDAVLLPSFYEGCPNAIIDGMLCGMPILASNVSDNEIYLEHQIELLFNPNLPSEIAEKIIAFSKLDENKKRQLGKVNKNLAENYFEVSKMVHSYIKLLK